MPPTTPTSRPRLTDLLDARFMARLDRLDLVSRKILQGKLQGERRSKRRGQSVEFADHRPYVVGDDLRFVDWNIYGRLDQLFLKLFLEEQDLTVHLALDTSASQSLGDPPKDRFIKRLAAALAYAALVNNNRVTLSTFNAGLAAQLPNIRGRNYLSRMAEFLLTASPQGPTLFDQSCRQIASSRLGRGVMIVLSDFLFKEGYQPGLRRLISRQYDLYVIHVLSPQELNPPLTGDLRLIDVEDDDASEVTANAALMKYYHRTLNAYCQELQAFCTQRAATCVHASSADSVENLVLNTLRRVGMLR